MPVSRYSAIPVVCETVLHLNPSSILDIGVGWGRWGMLFREYTDIWRSRLGPDEWETVIEGIEAWKAYDNPIIQYVYDKMFWGPAQEVLPNIKRRYDLVFLGDVIEHFTKDEGLEALRLCLGRAKKLVLITTPLEFKAQRPKLGNPYERHVSFWELEDFKRFKGVKIKVESCPPQIVVWLHKEDEDTNS